MTPPVVAAIDLVFAAYHGFVHPSMLADPAVVASGALVALVARVATLASDALCLASTAFALR